MSNKASDYSEEDLTARQEAVDAPQLTLTTPTGNWPRPTYREPQLPYLLGPAY